MKHLLDVDFHDLNPLLHHIFKDLGSLLIVTVPSKNIEPAEDTETARQVSIRHNLPGETS